MNLLEMQNLYLANFVEILTTAKRPTVFSLIVGAEI